MLANELFLGFLGSFGPTELIVILVIVLVLFGAKKIPDLARGFGKGITEFKRGLKEPVDDNTSQDASQDAVDGSDPKKLDESVGPKTD
jgi:sec-independent protein translocase protein TatA